MQNNINIADMEMCVLGAIMLHPELKADWFFANTKADYFSHPFLRRVFLTLQSLYEKNPSSPTLLFSVNAVYEQMIHLGYGEFVSSRVDIAEIMNLTATAENIEYHLDILKERFYKDRLLALAIEIKDLALEPITESQEIKNHWEQKMEKLFEIQKNTGFVEIGAILPSVIEQIEKIRAGELPDWSVPSGFIDLDYITGGFLKSNLILLAGRPSMGKTSLALNIATNVASGNKPVGIITIESSDLSLAEKFLCQLLNLSNSQISSGRITAQELQSLKNGLALANLPIYLDYPANPELSDLKSKARILKKEKNICLLIVDYLQLIRVDRKFESKQVEVSFISANLKALAKELNIPVIACCQLSRKVEEREDKEPELSDLRESGALEQDADLVLMIWRPEFYNPEKEPGTAYLKIAKNRNGQAGRKIKLTFRAEYTKFENGTDK